MEQSQPKYPGIHIRFDRSGEGGNVFSIIARTCKALGEAAPYDQVQAFKAAAFSSHSYEEVLDLVRGLVTVDDDGEWEDLEDMRRIVRDDR